MLIFVAVVLAISSLTFSICHRCYCCHHHHHLVFDSISYCWPCLTLPVGKTTNLWLVDSIKLPRHKYDNKCDIKCDKMQDNLRGQTCLTEQNFTIAPQIGAQRKKQVLFPLKPPKAHITLFGYSMKTSSFWSSLYNTNKIIRDIFENKGLPRFSHIYGSLLSCDVFWDEGVKTPLFSLQNR